MKTAVIFYSFSGTTKKLARQAAAETGADLFEARTARPLGKFKAYTWGTFAALTQKTMPIAPIDCNLNDYEKIIIMGPIWAGHPAPAVNSVFHLLPPGKDIDLRFVSMSGGSRGKDAVLLKLADKGCASISYTDIKA